MARKSGRAWPEEGRGDLAVLPPPDDGESPHLRPIGPGDGHALAHLFRLAFHGCYPYAAYMDPTRMEAMIAAGTLAGGLVAVVGDGTIVGTASRIREPWNDSFEIGKTAVHPEWRRLGIARAVASRAVESGFERGLAICHALCRNEGTYRMSRHDRLVVNGFVPGLARVHEAETYILGYRMSAAAKRARVADAGNPLYRLPAIARVVAELDLDSTYAPYPRATLVGPPARTSRRVALDGSAAAFSDHALLLRQLPGLGALPPAADHLQVDVLVDKLELLETLMRFGFQMVGFLPGWYAEEGRRFDCVRLVNCRAPIRFDGAEGSRILDRLAREFEYRPPSRLSVLHGRHA